MASRTSGDGSWHAYGGWRNHAWLLPAMLGTSVTGLLSWAAWVNVRDTNWPDLHHAWWWAMLRPNQDGTVLAAAALWVASLAAYWWPRRFQRRPIALIVVVAMVIIGGTLSMASMLPCRAGTTSTGVLGWLLDLYLGQPPPPYPAGVCQGLQPLAIQLGQILCPGATLIGAIAVGASLWREPVGRLRSRFARDATVFTGLNTLTLPLLRRLAQTARNPRDIIVIEPDQDHALLEEVRLTGARVVIGDPVSPRLLQPIIIGLRGCALRELYALGDKVQENETVVATAAQILSRYQADSARQPHLVALVDDPRHADTWRGSHGGASGRWFEDALSSVESTARGLVNRVMAAGARELLLCGDSSLALAILIEFARRAWEFAELEKAAATGRDAMSTMAAEPPQMSVERVLLLDPRAEDMRREYVASVPWAVLDSGPAVVPRPIRWHNHLLRTLDATDQATARQTAVIILDSHHENGLNEGGRIARLHPHTPIFVLASPGEGISRPIYGQLMPFECGLLVDGEVPEDTWTRVARHWHECYRLSRPVEPGDPRTTTRLPWDELDESNRLINILQLRSILTQAAALGRRWEPVRLVPPGSYIELNDTELEQIAMAAHTRWYRQRIAEGWSAAAPGPSAAAGRHATTPAHATSQTNKLLVPWAELPADERAGSKERVRTQVAQLEDVGFMPAVPKGGPPEAESFERDGVVQARRLIAQLRWTLQTGEEMVGEASDWRVIDSTGTMRTITDPEFRSSHEPLGSGRWRRVGTFRAWQTREAVLIRTKEGKATARPGDWVVEGSGGERWPVTDDQFQSSYRPRPDLPDTPGQASTQTAMSSTTAPTISS